jgi:hypothetical protein
VLGRDSEARSALEQAEAAFTDLEGSAAVDLPDFAAARSDYHAQWGEPQPTRRWIEIHRERFLAARKGDRADEAFNRWIYVGNLTMVGLHDAAIELLREVLDGPGGHGFRYIDSHPAVDPLRDLPAYAELRRRYGDAR